MDFEGFLSALEPRLRAAVGSGVEIRTELAATRGLAVDLEAFERVIVDLALNACDAMPRGGTITFASADVDVSAGPGAGASSARDALPPGRYVQLVITDTGCGMTPDVLGCALDPFFTTKPAGQGAGLGLSSAQRMVREAGGSLGLESEFGAGTRVVIVLPA